MRLKLSSHSFPSVKLGMFTNRFVPDYNNFWTKQFSKTEIELNELHA